MRTKGLKEQRNITYSWVSGPNWVLPGASGGRLGGLGCRLELAGALSRAGWGFAGVGSETGLSGTGTVSVRAWRAVTCHSSTSPRHTGSLGTNGRMQPVVMAPKNLGSAE